LRAVIYGLGFFSNYRPGLVGHKTNNGGEIQCSKNVKSWKNDAFGQARFEGDAQICGKEYGHLLGWVKNQMIEITQEADLK